ncbi:hypothetical protein DVH05_017343 [Phytophthora capsici]|nr:hypothetical protein DVH05_017343 [Phytophthora capsici]
MLLEVIPFIEARHVALSGRMIIRFGRLCADKLRIPASQRPRFARTGWFRHFQVRYGISSRRAYGEVGSVNIAPALEAARDLRKKIGRFHPSDVFNMDAAYFFKATPRTSVCLSRAPAKKQNMSRVTLVEPRRPLR